MIPSLLSAVAKGRMGALLWDRAVGDARLTRLGFRVLCARWTVLLAQR